MMVTPHNNWKVLGAVDLGKYGNRPLTLGKRGLESKDHWSVDHGRK